MSRGGPDEAKSLEEFLSTFKVSTGSTPTHTRFGDAFGSYYIPSAYSDAFYDHFSQHVYKRKSHRSNRSICLVERHTEYGPVVIDFDFRFKLPAGAEAPLERRYCQNWIRRVLRVYFRELAKWIDLSSDVETDVYVMEKPAPRRDKDCVKDGIHIVLPSVVTHPRVQHLIRRNLLAPLKPIFDDLGITNTHDNAFDEAVIDRNGWMLYGSGKNGDVPYEVTRVYRAKVNKYDEVDISEDEEWMPPTTRPEIRALVELLSIRNKNDRTINLKPEKKIEIQRQIDVEDRARKRIAESPYMQVESGQGENIVASNDTFELARKLVGVLDDDRAEDYNTWMRVGWCLHNIDHRLLNDWIQFSRRSPKFQHGVCELYWSHMTCRKDGLGMGSLKMWTKEDSPDLYDSMIRQSLAGKIRVAMSCTHHDIANVVATMFAGRFVCTSIKNNYWYEFKKHRWVSCDSGFTLRRFLSIDVYNKFHDEASSCSNLARGMSADDGRDEEHQRLTSLHDKLTSVAKRLKCTSFKDAIMKECRELMYAPNFESLLDSKPNLLGFENGVYDLDSHEFREGCPEDMVSFSTKQDYVPFDVGCHVYQEIITFFEQIQTDKDVREYLLRLLSSCLHGLIREERFHVFTGTGSNGKSICVDLFEKALGDYSCKVPVTLLTQKRAASNAATSEIARCKGRRFVCLQEPGNDEVLNIGLMKELTGGDRIMARPLYKEPIEFRPMMKLAMTANNLPEVRSDDGGTWRRIRVIDYNSKFVEKPDPDQENEFQLDVNLSRRLEGWAPHFMSLLIEYYKVYEREGNPEPLPVLAVTRQYRQNNDVIQMFIDHNLELDQKANVSTEVVHNKYKEFVKEHGLFNFGSMKRNEVIQSIMRHTKSRMFGAGSRSKLTGIRMKLEDFSDEPPTPPPADGAAPKKNTPPTADDRTTTASHEHLGSEPPGGP